MPDDRRCASDGEIASYLEGTLPSARLAMVEAHLDVCRACASVVTQAARTARSRERAGEGMPRIFNVGQIIAGRYQILGFLGAGGMGEVYEAQDQALGDRIALKTVSAAASFDERAVQRLKAEVQLARRVTHRNVCRIFDFGVHPEQGPADGATLMTPFLTMELLRGRPLADHVSHGTTLPPDVVADCAAQIAAGLAAAHEAGVIHRDLKSDNVLFLPASGSGFRAVITDFGLAGTIQTTLGEAGSCGGSSLHGAAPYLAPERLAGMPASAAADIYALGVILWELATGKLAASGEGAPRWEDLLPVGPLTSVVRDCLEANPARRPQRAAIVQARLERAPNSARRPIRRARRLAGTVLAGMSLAALSFALAMAAHRASSRDRVPSLARSGTADRPATVARQPGGPSLVETIVAPPPRVQATSGTIAGTKRRRTPSARPRPEGGAAPPAPAPIAPAIEDPAIRGEQLIVEGRFEEACAALEQARAARPDHAPVYRMLGQCYMRSGRPEPAKKNYRAYLELAPGAADTAFIKGILR